MPKERALRPPARNGKTAGNGKARNGQPKSTAMKGADRLRAAPVSYGIRKQSTAPRTRPLPNGGIRVEHREEIDDSLPGSTTFTVQNAFALNPGLAASFPWLSTLAKNYEQYAVKKMIFEYEPIAPSSTQGKVIISPEYDATDVNPTTELQASASVGTVSDICWTPFICVLNPTAMMGLGPRRFVRTTNRAGDLRSFDVGKVFVCTNNETGTSVIGKIWVTYEIELYCPQNSPSGDSSPAQTCLYERTTAQTLTTTVETALEWDAATYDPLGFGAPATGVFTPAAGVYLVSATASFQDGTGENFLAILSYYKNGSAIAGATSYAKAINTAASVVLLTHIEWVVTLNGTDTFEVRGQLTGAAGTLTFYAAANSLIVRLA